MKKMIFVFTIILLSIASFHSYAQVSFSKPKAPEYEFISYESADVYHDFKDDTYTYMVDSTNEFEDSCIHIKLGKGKAESINSLLNIVKMYEAGRDRDTITLGGYDFTIDKKTNGINGESVMYATKAYAAGLYKIRIINLLGLADKIENN